MLRYAVFCGALHTDLLCIDFSQHCHRFYNIVIATMLSSKSCVIKLGWGVGAASAGAQHRHCFHNIEIVIAIALSTRNVRLVGGDNRAEIALSRVKKTMRRNNTLRRSVFKHMHVNVLAAQRGWKRFSVGQETTSQILMQKRAASAKPCALRLFLHVKRFCFLGSRHPPFSLVLSESKYVFLGVAEFAGIRRRVAHTMNAKPYKSCLI